MAYGTKYTITTETADGVDIVSFDCPMTAINVIQDARREGAEVTYTGDPFADFAALLASETEG